MTMPPLYIINLGLYSVLTAFVLYLIFSLVMESKNIWEQIMAIIAIVPLAMRLFLIK